MKKATTKTKLRPVIVTTEYRGVFYGFANGSTAGDTIKLKDARMAIYWGTERGLHQLAHTGPTSKTTISAPADVELRKVTAVYELSDEAAKAWAARS